MRNYVKQILHKLKELK